MIIAVVETAELQWVVSDVNGANISDQVTSVNHPVTDDFQVPWYVAHQNVLRSAEQQPHRLPQWQVALKERVETEAPPVSAGDNIFIICEVLPLFGFKNVLFCILVFGSIFHIPQCGTQRVL